MAASQEAAQNEQAFRGPPLHLLVFAFQHELTGTVTIDTEGGQRHQVYFLEGAPAKVLLAENVLTLDSIIVRMGAVPPEALVETSRMAYDQGKLLGRALVARGLISEETLSSALRWQVQEKVAHLMGLSDRTHYTVQPGQNHLASYGGVDNMAIDPLVMIIVAARLPASSAVLDRNANELRGLLLGISETAPLERLYPTDDEKRVIEMMLAQPHSVDSLIDSGADERAVKSLLFTLSTAQLIEEIEEIIEDIPDDEMPVQLADDAIEVVPEPPAAAAIAPPVKEPIAPPVQQPAAIAPPVKEPIAPPIQQPAAIAPPVKEPIAPPVQQPAAIAPPIQQPAAIAPPVQQPAAIAPPVQQPAAIAPPVAQASAPEHAAPAMVAPDATIPEAEIPPSQPQAEPPLQSYHAAPSGSGSARPDPFWDEPLYDEPPVSSRAGDSAIPGSLDPGYDQHHPPDGYGPGPYESAPGADEAPTSSHDIEQPTQQTAVTTQRHVNSPSRPEARRSRRATGRESSQGDVPTVGAPEPVHSPPSQRAVARVQVKKQVQSRSGAPLPSQPVEATKKSIAGNILRKIRGDEEPEEEPAAPVIPVDKPDWCMADFDGLSSVEAYAIAEESLKILNYGKAEAAAAKAVSEDMNNATYRTTHAWIQAKRLGTPMSGKEDEWYADQIAVLTDVLIGEPNFEPAYYYRARIYKSAKLMKKAMEDFEMCTMLNPGNVDAQRELKEYKMLRAKQRRRRALDGPDEPQKKGFLDWVSDKVKG